MLKNFLISIFNIIDNTLGFIGIDTDKLMAKLQVRWLYNGKLNRRLFRSNEERGKLNLYIEYVPDRYCDGYESYKQSPNFLAFSDIEKWTEGNSRINAGDLTRFFFINLCIDSLLEENLIGNVVELGVFKGNSAFLLSKFAKRISTKCYLFDTFEGFDARDLTGRDAQFAQFEKPLFSDTSLEAVKEVVQGGPNTLFVKGYFPESLKKIDSVGELILVHVDCDLEKPIAAALDYFYPKIKKGGFLIMHDYSSLNWPGAKHAINEFFKDKPEFVVPIPDKSGTCVIRKM